MTYILHIATSNYLFHNTVGFLKEVFIQILMYTEMFSMYHQNYLRILCTPFLFLCIYLFIFLQMKSTTVLYRYNDISRKNGFYSLNIRHAAITGAIYTLVSANIYLVTGFYANKDLYQNVVGTFFIAKVRCTPIWKKSIYKVTILSFLFTT